MSRRDDPYLAVYWRLADEFPEVWDDDHALAWYLRLLKSADGAWPSSADMPAGIPARTWRLLVDVELVLPQPGGRRYRIRGMDKRRNATSNAARNAARSRWGNAEAMPHSTAQHSTAQIDPNPAERGQRMNPRATGTNPRAVARREAKRKADIANALQMRYLRGELSEEQHRQARQEAGL